jgi:hypothetical protein
MAPPSLRLVRSSGPARKATADPDKIAKLRTQLAQNQWHTEKLRLLGFEESYRESRLLGESLSSQLDEALKSSGDAPRSGS